MPAPTGEIMHAEVRIGDSVIMLNDAMQQPPTTRVIGPGQCPPPQTEPACTVPHSEVRVQHDPIHAIVAASQQFLIPSAQPIHGGHATSTVRSLSNCPEGATFSQPGLRKSVDS